MSQTQGQHTSALSWAVAVLGAALLACGGVTTFQPGSEDPSDSTWQNDTLSERVILCCDGHLADTCPCRGSGQGCCTGHDGVCGCRRVAGADDAVPRSSDVARLTPGELPVEACTQSTH